MAIVPLVRLLAKPLPVLDNLPIPLPGAKGAAAAHRQGEPLEPKIGKLRRGGPAA